MSNIFGPRDEEDDDAWDDDDWDDDYDDDDDDDDDDDEDDDDDDDDDEDDVDDTDGEYALTDKYLTPNPKDYYFNAGISQDPLSPGTIVSICPRSFFDRYGYPYDQHISQDAGGPLNLDSRFEEMVESVFMFDGSVIQAEIALKQLGMGHNPKIPV